MSTKPGKRITIEIAARVEMSNTVQSGIKLNEVGLVFNNNEGPFSLL